MGRKRDRKKGGDGWYEVNERDYVVVFQIMKSEISRDKRTIFKLRHYPGCHVPDC